MHKIAKEIMERVKSKINSCGIDAINEQELMEMEYWTAVAKNITSYEYHYKIIEEMEKPENKYGVNYDERGRFYTNLMDQHRTDAHIYDPNMENYRDMDMRRGRMYYTDNSNMGASNNGAYNNGYQESRYDRARRGYEESKQMNPNMDNMTAMEQIFDTFEDDIKALKPKMTTNEKSIARNKLTNMSNMMM